MLRRSFTAVLEKGSSFGSDFETEPYEAGWASEARWFLQVLQADPGKRVLGHAQVSPDGAIWCDEGSGPMVVDGEGMATVSLRGFGSWLRIRVEVLGTPGQIKVLIYLVLKE